MTHAEGPSAFCLMDVPGVNLSMDQISGHRRSATPSLKEHATHARPRGRYGRAKETYRGESPVSCAKISAILNSISANLSQWLSVEPTNRPRSSSTEACLAFIRTFTIT